MAKSFPQLHMLKIDVSHGSDRHEISIYSENQPTVADLIEELEKKTRVPRSYIQIIFKGQKLHADPKGVLSQFGIFNGSRLVMVGERLPPVEDAVFRRILGVGKDIALIEKSLNDTITEFSLIENGGLDRSMINEYLPQLNLRACGMKRDLEMFLRVISELDVDLNQLPDVKRQKLSITNKIQDDINQCESLIQRISQIKK